MKKFTTNLIFISMLAVNILFAFQTPISFTRQEFNLRGSSYGAVEFGDFDADGDLDLLVIGEEDIGVRVGMVYINEEGSFDSESFITLPLEFINGDAKWGDYDNDGDLDIFVAGASGGGQTRIFRNDEGSFTELTFDFFNLEDSAVDWGDYDNDGDLDAVVTGRVSADRHLYIYENQDGTFVDSGIELDGVRQCDIEFVDYDVDGDLDLFVTGLSASGRSTKLYRNDEGNFVDSGIEFVAMLDAASDFGDYDADGDLDLILSGNGNGYETIIYKNDINNFSKQSFVINGLEESDVKWADFDNDGDLDFIQSGESLDAYITEIYENTGSGFTRIMQDIPDSLKNSAITIGDYDNDGDMDFGIGGWNSEGDRFTIIYSNDAEIKNTAPIRPQTSGSTSSPDSVVLTWGIGADDETLASGLTYNMRIGTTPGGDEILTAHLTEEGQYMLTRRGNMESRLTWTIYNLPPGTYYWGVQTVDNNFDVSIFLPAQFTISVSPTFEEVDVGLPAYEFGEMAWGDYDNDRDLDLVVNSLVDGTAQTKIYKYDSGLETFTDAGIAINGSPLSNVDWGDYDNDGDLDLLTGSTLYRNDGFDNFTFIQEFSPSSSDLVFVDYDNDGDLDIHWAQTGNLYQNNEGVFSVDAAASASISGYSAADAAWGDYDNDGDKDLIITGGNYEARLYRNDDGIFFDWGYYFYGTEDGISFGSNGYQNADIEWADYDNDGDLDFIIIGEGRNQAVDVVRITALYQNQGEDKNNAGQWLFEQTDPEGSRGPNSRMYEAVSNGAVSWADFDNDGLKDFILSGSQGTSINPNDYFASIYFNNITNAFFAKHETDATMRGMGSISATSNSALAVADYDDDGDLDFMQFGYSGNPPEGLDDATRLYKNMLNEKSINEQPAPPVNLSHEMHGDTVLLIWDAAEDDKSAALTYNVRIGTQANAQDVVSANAHPDGRLKMVFQGNAQAATKFKLVGLAQDQGYFWSVQSIDAGFRSSAFAAESKFNTFEPSISVTFPQLASTLIGGEPDTIRWTSNNIQNIKIEFSANGGLNWNEIESSWPAADGEYIWNVPEIETVTALIRLSDVTNPEINATSSNFIIGERFVLLQYPNGGEVFKPDSSIFIDFLSPYTSDFKMEYSTNNGIDWTEIGVVNETFGTSSEPWTIPNVSSNECRVKVTDINHPTVSDISDGTFSIVGENVRILELISPNGGEKLEAGSVPTIFWNQNNVSNIRIEVSFDSGYTYGTLTPSTSATEGWYTWYLPNTVHPDCFVRITDVDDESVTDINETSFAITDTVGPTFVNDEGIVDFTPVVNNGDQDTISVKLFDNTDVINSVKLFFKPSDATGGFNERIMNLIGDEYEWISDPVPFVGYQFFIEAADQYQNISRTDTFGISVRIDDKFENAIENVGGNSVDAYVLFSLPVDLFNKSPAEFLRINNFDDTPDPQDYRFYSYQNGSSNNFIEYNDGGFGQMEPGKAFFILSNDDFNMVAGEGTTVNPAYTFEIPGLQQGWNLIGNPFSYEIPLSNIYAENLSGTATVDFRLWVYESGWKRVEGGNIIPWKGYALDLDENATLKIRPYREPLAKISPTFTTLNNNNDEWMIQIKARNGKSKSDFNFIGQAFDASNGTDKLDLNAPPRFLKQVALAFKNETKKRFVTDIRESNNLGHTWDFICYTNPKEEKLNLSFSGINNFISDKDIFLIDEDSRTSYNLKNNTELQFAAKGVSNKNFKIAIGTKEYLEGLNLETDLYPKEFSLKQNFPNPFNSSTQISFTVKNAGPVNLTVYDLLGQQVAVLINDNLEAGNYSSIWDASGQSSGIYFIKLTSGKNVDIKRAIFIK